jgi:hypothetical protein
MVPTRSLHRCRLMADACELFLHLEIWHWRSITNSVNIGKYALPSRHCSSIDCVSWANEKQPNEAYALQGHILCCIKGAPVLANSLGSSRLSISWQSFAIELESPIATKVRSFAAPRTWVDFSKQSNCVHTSRKQPGILGIWNVRSHATVFLTCHLSEGHILVDSLFDCDCLGHCPRPLAHFQLHGKLSTAG